MMTQHILNQIRSDIDRCRHPYLFASQRTHNRGLDRKAFTKAVTELRITKNGNR